MRIKPLGGGSGALGSGGGIGGRRSFRVSGLVWAALLSSRLRMRQVQHPLVLSQVQPVCLLGGDKQGH